MKRKLGEGDYRVLAAAKGEGTVYALDAKALESLGRAATAAWEAFWEEYEPWVTQERAEQVRRWRVEEDCSWRRIAELAHEAWGGTWSPPSNQIIGMVLCDAAAHAFGQHYMEEPWN